VLRSFFLPHRGRTDVHWFQVRFSVTEPYAVEFSWLSFLVRRGLADHTVNCMVMVFIRSTALNVTKESQSVLCYHVGKRKTLWHCPDFRLWYYNENYESLGSYGESVCHMHQSKYQSTLWWPVFHNQDWNYGTLELCWSCKAFSWYTVGFSTCISIFPAFPVNSCKSE